MEKPHLLVVSAGAAQQYRAYILESLARKFDITLLDHRHEKWTQAFSSRIIEADVLDEDALAQVVALNKKKPLNGILCYDELRIVAAARLAQKFQLPTTDPEALLACRDKYKTRLALEQAGVGQPRFHLAANEKEALQCAADLGYPLVIKPRALMASEGVRVIHSPEELKNHYKATADLMPDKGDEYKFSTILLEEYVEGEEVSIDGMVEQGNYTSLFLAHKTTGFPPYFEELAHEIRFDDTLLANQEFQALLNGVHTALNQQQGMTHTEVKITKRGPVVIEVNARLGGDLIPRLGWYATDVDAAHVAGALAVGDSPCIAPSQPMKARIQFYYPHGALRIENLTLPSIHGIVEAQSLVESGDVVALPPRQFVVGRLAYAIAVGQMYDDLKVPLSEFGQYMVVKGISLP